MAWERRRDESMELYYLITFIVSCLLTGIYMFIWHKHFDVHITLLFVLAPITNMGFWLMARAETLEGALRAFNLTFIGGCFLELMMMLMVFSLCEIRVSRWMKTALLIASAAVFGFTLTIGESGLFYQSIEISRTNGVTRLLREYGPMHTVFRWLVVLYFGLSLGCILFSFWKKKQISRKILTLLFLPILVAVIAYYGGRTAGIAAIFATVEEVVGQPVRSLFNPKDLPGYQTYDAIECPWCRAGVRLDALVNNFGYSKL